MLLLKFLRVKGDRSVRQLASAADIYRQDLSAIEKGRVNPSSDELRRLAKALKFDGDPHQLLVHVDATPLGDGADHRDGQREARS